MHSTVNGKTLSYWSPLGTFDKDTSGNILKEGDLIFHVSGSRSRTYSIKTVVTLTTDHTKEQFLGVKLDNGQYSDLSTIDCFKVNESFKSLHKKYLSNSHKGLIEEFVHFKVDLDAEDSVLNFPKDLYEKHYESFEKLFEKEYLFEWYYRGTLQNMEECVTVHEGKGTENMSYHIRSILEEALDSDAYNDSFKRAIAKYI